MMGAVYTGDDAGRVVSADIWAKFRMGSHANEGHSMSGTVNLLTGIRKERQDGLGGESDEDRFWPRKGLC